MQAINASRLSSFPRGPQMCFNACSQEICGGNSQSLRCPDNEGRAPDFFLIGYSQAGSSFLNGKLKGHKNVGRACKKEIRFFDRRLLRWGNDRIAKGRDPNQVSFTNYFRCFGTPNAQNVVGDHTVKTIYTDSAMPVWLRAVNPNMKLIVLLRNPMDRIKSRFSHLGNGLRLDCAKLLKSKGACSRRNFDLYVSKALDFIERECALPTSDDYAGRMNVDPAIYKCSSQVEFTGLETDTILSSLYVEHIKHWFKFFPREQFLFVQADDLFKQTARTMKQITDYLGLPAHSVEELELYRAPVNSHTKSKTRAGLPVNMTLSPSTAKRLETFLEPYNRRLERLLADPSYYKQPMGETNEQHQAFAGLGSKTNEQRQTFANLESETNEQSQTFANLGISAPV
mmetsp:Transcript_36451/g.58677  ORF Transcript_36451/g.58677 Transcript_36451/m.58677 type:complete len:398 (-) Transcript_36451:1079-2272(-)